MLSDVLRQMAARCAARFRSGLVDLGLMAAIGTCLVLAAGFSLSAVHAALRPLVGPAWASGLLAAGLAIAALGLAMLLSSRRKAALPAPPVAPPVTAAPADAAPPPSADLATTAAFVAGFLLARRF